MLRLLKCYALHRKGGGRARAEMLRLLQGLLVKTLRMVGFFSRLASTGNTEQKPHPSHRLFRRPRHFSNIGKNKRKRGGVFISASLTIKGWIKTPTVFTKNPCTTRFSASAGTFWSWNTSQLENKSVWKYILVELSKLEHQSVGKNVGLDSDRKSANFYM